MSIIRKHLERPFELKSLKSDGTFTGYASVYGEIDSYRDVVIKGAFNISIEKRYVAKKRPGIPMLWQHQMSNPIGLYPLEELKEDDYGFLVGGVCNMDVQQGKEAHALMKQGALSGLSIGYTTEDDEWDDAGKVRLLKEVDLWEISPVTFPAGDSARVTAVKSIEDAATISELEKYLRDVGMSKSEAVTFISRAKALTQQGDPVDEEALRMKNLLQTIRSL